MAAVLLEGYTVKCSDYQNADSLFWILAKNRVLKCIALGTRKINSKNGKLVRIGTLNNYEIFLSGSNKFSKLKKGTNKKTIEIDNLDKLAGLEVIGQIFSILDSQRNISSNIFEFYSKVYEYLVSKEWNDLIIGLSILCFLPQINHRFIFDKCVRCRKNVLIKTLSFNEGGFICSFCLTKNDKIYPIELLKFLKKTASLKNLGNFLDYSFESEEIKVIFLLEITMFINDNLGLFIPSLFFFTKKWMGLKIGRVV